MQVLAAFRSRQDAIAKAEIVRLTELTLATVTEHVELLVMRGLLREEEFGHSSGGRRPKLYGFNVDAGRVLAVDLESTFVRVAVTPAPFIGALGATGDFSMIPKDLTKQHFLQAAAKADREGYPADRRSVHYDLVIDGRRYPPKYIVSLATELLTGRPYSAQDFNAVEAKNYFTARGYEILDRRGDAEKKIVEEDDESAFPEGHERYSWHRKLERDAKIAKKAKAKRLAVTGSLTCEVCATDFATKYGTRGEGFIEAHHIKPVAALDGKEKTAIKDFALVCSNCHRMLHRGKKLISVHQLKHIVEQCSGA